MYGNRVHFKFLFGPIYLFPSFPSDTLMIVFLCVEKASSAKETEICVLWEGCCEMPLYTFPLCRLIHSNGKIQLTMEIHKAIHLILSLHFC